MSSWNRLSFLQIYGHQMSRRSLVFLLFFVRLVELEQYGRRTSLRFHNVPMTQGDLQQTDGLIVNIVNDKLGLAQPLTENDISVIKMLSLLFLRFFFFIKIEFFTLQLRKRHINWPLPLFIGPIMWERLISFSVRGCARPSLSFIMLKISQSFDNPSPEN
jgi:hypothetical protein